MDFKIQVKTAFGEWMDVETLTNATMLEAVHKKNEYQKEDRYNKYRIKEVAMTREEMFEKLFSNSISDKLSLEEKKLMTDSEIAIFNTAYDEGWDDGYSEGIEDHNITAHKAYVDGIKNAMKWFERTLIKELNMDKSFVQNLVMEWAAADLLTED